MYLICFVHLVVLIDLIKVYAIHITIHSGNVVERSQKGHILRIAKKFKREVRNYWYREGKGVLNFSMAS